MHARLVFLLLASLLPPIYASASLRDSVTQCDLVIAGGSLSALAAALSSAASQVKTCLLEPTDWVGGQASASGVPAIDWAWHQVTTDNRTENVASIDRDPANVTPTFRAIMQKLGDPGACWVSINCFAPEAFVSAANALIEALPYLTVYYNTVVSEVQTESDGFGGVKIASITAVARTPQPNVSCNGYDRFLSEDLVDWYSPVDSNRFTKSVMQFAAPVFLDATEWGELMALADAPYLQAMSEQFDGDNSGIGNDTCGQASTLGFIQVYNAAVVNESADPLPIPEMFRSYWSLLGNPWQKVWTYRRLYAAPPANPNVPAAGDFTVQNWDHGNDNSFSYESRTVTFSGSFSWYLLMSRANSALQIKNGTWAGGVNLTSLQIGEQLAYGYHYWFKSQTNVSSHLSMSHSLLGTCHGLAKIPYMRDTRRSIGLGGFVMNVTQITGTAQQVVGEVFYDRLAIGAYDCDIHAMQNCSYPSYITQGDYQVLPFFVPFRAMTNIKISNLLLSGKTMATSFLVNAASRLHPIEWSTGTAAGAAAAYIVRSKISTTADALAQIADIQAAVAKFTPIAWNVNGVLYPPAQL